MQMPTRKETKIKTPFTGKNASIVAVIYALSFFASNWYGARGQLELTSYAAANYGYSLSLPTGLSGYFLALVISSATALLVTELLMKLYYFFAFRAMRGLMPFSVREFKLNLRPFLAARNIVVGLLSLLCLTEDGYFVTFGLNYFEMLATMIMIFPFYGFMKKHYIADDCGGRVLLSFAVYYVVFNAATFVSLLV